MHRRNKYQGTYYFDELVKCLPDLNVYLIKNAFNQEMTLDFSNPKAVKALNKALLMHFYGLKYWDIPDNFLCPPIPSRSDYIHYLSDLIPQNSSEKIKCLDIGTGANCIYPLIGFLEYGWEFVAVDIDDLSLKAAKDILEKNSLTKFIQLRKQAKREHLFKNIIMPSEHYYFTMCNPPFFSSAKEAAQSSNRKNQNLKLKKRLNFGGLSNELWCEGGEVSFLSRMIAESADFKKQVHWFTTLVSKGENLNILKENIKNVHASKVKVIEMKIGNKVSRILAWSFV